MLDRILYFVFGVFVAIIIGVPISLGIVDEMFNQQFEFVVLLFSAICGAIVTLVIIAILRNYILRSVINTTEVRISEVADKFGLIVQSAMEKKPDMIAHHSKEFSKILVAWYSWTSFYRWVVGITVTMFVAFASFSGVILLVEQNNIIQRQSQHTEEQNDIQALQIARNFRDDIIKQAGLSSDGIISVRESRELNFIFGSCEINLPFEKLYPPPNRSTIEQILLLIKSNSHLRERFIVSFQNLMYDNNPTVAVAAIRVLDKLESIPENAEISLNKIALYTLEIKSTIYIKIYNSEIFRFDCQNCVISAFSSHIVASKANRIDLFNSMFFGNANDADVYSTTSVSPDKKTKFYKINDYITDNHQDWLNVYSGGHRSVNRKEKPGAFSALISSNMTAIGVQGEKKKFDKSVLCKNLLNICNSKIANCKDSKE